MTSRVFRIGQIVPSSNTTMETEIPAMLRAREAVAPERFTFHSARMRMQKVTAEELKAMDAASDRCAAELADALVLSSCVQMPSLAAIPIVEQECGLPVVSAAVCTTYQMLEALGLPSYVPDAGALLSGVYSSTPVSV
jgi:maleate cis-trans isomerase